MRLDLLGSSVTELNSIGPHWLLESPGIADGSEVFVVESVGRDFNEPDLALPFWELGSCSSVSVRSEVEIRSVRSRNLYCRETICPYGSLDLSDPNCPACDADIAPLAPEEPLHPNTMPMAHDAS